jgi:hypothetical protein
MLNGLEKTLERKLPEGERRWIVKEHSESYSDSTGLADPGWPLFPETRNLKPSKPSSLDTRPSPLPTHQSTIAAPFSLLLISVKFFPAWMCEMKR